MAVVLRSLAAAVRLAAYPPAMGALLTPKGLSLSHSATVRDGSGGRYNLSVRLRGCPASVAIGAASRNRESAGQGKDDERRHERAPRMLYGANATARTPRSLAPPGMPGPLRPASLSSTGDGNTPVVR